MVVVKANAYGHGSVAICKFLEEHGYYDFAVATGSEGEELRRVDVSGNIYVLGSCSIEEISTCYENNLIPTASSVDFLAAWAEHWKKNKSGIYNADGIGKVIIKIDTGMSRYGCQPSELPQLIQFCRNNKIPVHSMYTHFAQAWDDHDFTNEQYKTFLEVIKPYRSSGIEFHVSNSGAILKGIGIDLDYIRPGLSVYGLPQDTSEYCISKTKETGLRPAACWMAKTSLVKRLPTGRKVGYDQTYVCKESETIASVPLGYVDGYPRNTLNGTGALTTLNGTNDEDAGQTLDAQIDLRLRWVHTHYVGVAILRLRSYINSPDPDTTCILKKSRTSSSISDVCPVVGRISMDGITIKIHDDVTECQELYVMKDDFNSTNSIISLAKLRNSIPCETCTNFGTRLPRLYIQGGRIAYTL